MTEDQEYVFLPLELEVEKTEEEFNDTLKIIQDGIDKYDSEEDPF